MKVIVNAETCTGHGRCAALAPEFYELDDEGYNALRGQGAVEVPSHLAAAARLGADACPEGAISISD